MADLTVVSPARAANALTGESAAAGGDAFTNTGKELLVIESRPLPRGRGLKR